MRGVNRLLDLGGGSGVVSLALLCKRAELTAVVVDAASVCQVGRAIASENQLERMLFDRHIHGQNADRLLTVG